MPSLKYRSAQLQPLAPPGFGSHKLDGVRSIMCEFSNQVKVLHNVTPIDLLAQSAVLLVQARRISGGYVGLLKKYCHAPVGGNCLVQNHHNHPVRLRLPPLHRRGMYQCRYFFNSPTCPPKRVASARFIHSSIKFMQTIIRWRVAARFVQDGTVGQTYESAPTGGYHKFNGAWRFNLCNDDTSSTTL